MNTFDVMNPCFATEQNMGRVRFSKTWAMPNHNTFSIKPIKEFVARWTLGADVIVDPFARDSRVGTITNDLNPETDAQYHMKAEAFLNCLLTQGVEADVVLYDPPYSPRQVSECYKIAGLEVTQQDTQASFYTKAKDNIKPLVKDNGIVLSFGWNSTGVGKEGFITEEIMLVSHGGAHNDTICVAQRKQDNLQGELL